MPSEHTPPERLWHYTDGAGAKGIIQSRTLWAGHLGYMNDTSEVNHTMNESRLVATRLIDELPEHAGALKRWINDLTDSPPKSWAPNIFAVSFSEQRDLLSQWRGYATGTGGAFCLGFPAKLLLDRADPGWVLRRCVYSREEQQQMVETRIRWGLDRAQAAEVLPARKTRQEVAYAQIFSAVMGIAPLCKHPDFAEEGEWRLYKGPVSIRAGTQVGFRDRRHTLSPYIEFELSENRAPLDGLHWIAGPGPQQERANSALGWLARSEGFTRYQGSPSHTPYLP